MGWKNLKPWLKGGVIGILLYLVWAMFWWIMLPSSEDSNLFALNFLVFGLGIPLMLAVENIVPGLRVRIHDIMLFISPVLTVFFIGSILGLILSKFFNLKNKV